MPRTHRPLSWVFIHPEGLFSFFFSPVFFYPITPPQDRGAADATRHADALEPRGGARMAPAQAPARRTTKQGSLAGPGVSDISLAILQISGPSTCATHQPDPRHASWGQRRRCVRGARTGASFNADAPACRARHRIHSRGGRGAVVSRPGGVVRGGHGKAAVAGAARPRAGTATVVAAQPLRRRQVVVGVAEVAAGGAAGIVGRGRGNCGLGDPLRHERVGRPGRARAAVVTTPTVERRGARSASLGRPARRGSSFL